MSISRLSGLPAGVRSARAQIKFSLSLCALAAALSMTMLAATAHSAASSELRCRSAIESGLRGWLLAAVRTRQKCLENIVAGYGGSPADCRTDAGPIQRQLDEASAQLQARIESSCSAANWGLLSYPGPCADASPFDASALSECIETIGNETVEGLLSMWYPVQLDASRGAEAECLRTLPRRAFSMVLREMKVRLGCLLDHEGSGSGIDCRGQLPPYGEGTLDESYDRRIWRAQKAWLTGMPRTCSVADFAAMGYGTNCPYRVDLGAGLIQFQSCVFRHNRLQVPRLLDLAFPSDPVCGNGILQEGEECDSGSANSDTNPDACRLDCVFPTCGDGTADPTGGEDCDDGDFDPLDGCNESCGLEFCGDGAVNNLPQEVCDDGNQNPNDQCTGTCKAAACGDGVLCSDASCTSGPGGKPELCDLGTANVAGGMCEPDCSGFSRACTLKIGVTNSVNLGALTYELSYSAADGAFLGSGGSVQCISLVTGGLFSFFENENRRTVKESLIVNAGFQAPIDIASCNYVTNDAGLSPSDFKFVVEAASTPAFEPATASMAVTSLECTP